MHAGQVVQQASGQQQTAPDEQHALEGSLPRGFVAQSQSAELVASRHE